MSIEEGHSNDITFYCGGYEDICTERLSESQKRDIESLRSEKQRRERALIYTLINYAATTNDCEFAFIDGAIIGHYPNGAPFLVVPSTMGRVNISISHCRTGACIAISRSAESFGIDIEDESEKLLRVKEKFINDEESAFIGNNLLLVAWTIKESVYKAAGIEGLALREKIRIEQLTEKIRCDKGKVVTSEIAVGGIKYCGVSYIEKSRCTTLCSQEEDSSTK